MKIIILSVILILLISQKLRLNMKIYEAKTLFFLFSSLFFLFFTFLLIFEGNHVINPYLLYCFVYDIPSPQKDLKYNFMIPGIYYRFIQPLLLLL